MMLPHDLLPVKRPLEDDKKYGPFYFYKNVLSYLIEDVILMELTGIPINLDKVRNLEDVVSGVLAKTDTTLSNNRILKEFLQSLHEYNKEATLKTFHEKDKKPEDFMSAFNPDNTIHRTYVVNEYLRSIKHSGIKDKWTIKDVKALNDVLHDEFLACIVKKEYNVCMAKVVLAAMEKLAEEKAAIYNKNRLTKKLKDEEERPIPKFNPASTKQKLQLFNYLGIDSTSKTEGGQDKWNREELEKLYNLIDEMIKDKEQEDDTVEHS